MRNSLRFVRLTISLLLLVLITFGAQAQAKATPDPNTLERSYWVHASLGLFTQKGYFGGDYPATLPPTQSETQNAATLLCGTYAANRLYLIYHKEIPITDVKKVFRWWRQSCPPSIDIVPAILMRMYDKEQTPVFNADELNDLTAFFHSEINSNRLAVLDVYENRDQTPLLAKLGQLYPRGLIRLALQPAETVKPPFTSAVQDTWSGLCHGTRNTEDWLEPGFGAATLKKWVVARREQPTPITWNLVTVAWDYNATERGGFPGYDDAEKNMPLPAGRNKAAVRLIVENADPTTMAGFSTDLYILNENSRSKPHDGKEGAFYQTLRQGREYNGCYALPFQEIVNIFQQIRSGKLPLANQ